MSIGFLVVALIAGGLTSSHQIANFFEETPARVEVAPPPPGPGLEVVVGQLIDSVADLTDGVQQSVRGLIPISSVDQAWVTHYGESFNGQAMGCDGTPYTSNDAGIVAVGPARYAEWPCGTILRICGPAGCIVAQRTDGCPGCGPNHVDLSEEGLRLACGTGSGVCQASVEAFTLGCAPRPGRRDAAAGPLDLFATLVEIALSDRTADLLDLTQTESRGELCTVRGGSSPVLQP